MFLGLANTASKRHTSYNMTNIAISKCKPLKQVILHVPRCAVRVCSFWLFVRIVVEGQISRITSFTSSPRLAAQITREAMPAADHRGSAKVQNCHAKCATSAACLRHASALPSQELLGPPFSLSSDLLLVSGLCFQVFASLPSPARLVAGDMTTYMYNVGHRSCFLDNYKSIISPAAEGCPLLRHTTLANHHGSSTYTVALEPKRSLDLSDLHEGPRLFADQIAGSYADARLAGIQMIS